MSKPKPTLNSSDIKLIQDVMRITIDEELDIKLDEKLGKYPTKDEYYKREDQMMGELKAIREDLAVLAQHDQDQNDRLDRLDKFHTSPHPHFIHN